MVCRDTESDEVGTMKKLILNLLTVFCVIFLSSQSVLAYTCQAQVAGNWSDSSTWTSCNGTIPQNGDAVDLENYTVIWDIPVIPASGSLASLMATSRGELSLSSDAVCTTSCSLNVTGNISGAGVPGGSDNIFISILGSVGNQVTLTSNGALGFVSGNVGLMESVGGSSGIIVNGKITNNNNNYIVRQNDSSTWTINGDVTNTSTTGNCNNEASAIFSTGSGTITINGNVSAAGIPAVWNGAGATVNINGNVTGMTSDALCGTPMGSVNNLSYGTVNVVGNITGGNKSGFSAIKMSNGTLVATGNITGGSVANAYGIDIENSNSTASISGIITGGSSALSPAIYNGGNNQITLSNTSILVQSAHSPAYAGYAPAWTAGSNQAKFYVGDSFGQAANTTFSARGGGGSSAHSTAY